MKVSSREIRPRQARQVEVVVRASYSALRRLELPNTSASNQPRN